MIVVVDPAQSNLVIPLQENKPGRVYLQYQPTCDLESCNYKARYSLIFGGTVEEEEAFAYSQSSDMYDFGDPVGRRLYIACHSEHRSHNRILRYVVNPDGTVEDFWEKKITRIPHYEDLGASFQRPTSIAVDNQHNLLYVADGQLRRVYIYRLEVSEGLPSESWISNDLIAVRQGDLDDDGEFEFGFPQGLAVDDDSYLYVVDKRRHTVEKFEYIEGPPMTVRHVGTWGRLGREPGQFIYPYSIAADSLQNRVFVSDMINGRIQVFDRNGNLQDHWGRWDAVTGCENIQDGDFQLIHGVTVRCQTPIVISFESNLMAFSWKGDLDGDGDVDNNDLTQFNSCLGNPGEPPPTAECYYADLDRDGDVDQSDYGIFQQHMTGEINCSQ